MLTDNNINSIAIIIKMIFFLFNINPNIPTKNKSNDRFMVCICIFPLGYFEYYDFYFLIIFCLDLSSAASSNAMLAFSNSYRNLRLNFKTQDRLDR